MKILALQQNGRHFLPTKNKKLLICFLCNQFLQLASTHLEHNETFYVNGGCENGYAFILCKGRLNNQMSVTFTTKTAIYKTTHLEGDSVVWLHAVKCPSRTVLVVSIDKDICLPNWPACHLLPNIQINIS